MNSAKPPFANGDTPSAKGSILHLALREMRVFVVRSRFWVIVGGASLIAALAGPFYTLERMGFSGRFLYWGATAVSTGVMMTFLSMVMRRIAHARGLHWLPASLIAGALGVLPTMALIHIANRVSLLDNPYGGFWSLFPHVSLPVILITALVNALTPGAGLHGNDAAKTGNDDATSGVDSGTAANPTVANQDADGADENVALADSATTLLFSKLPATLGCDIVAIQAKDHYIEVTTLQGSALILMRLSDAERDLSALRGLRVHRSWWVNLPHVERLEKGTSGPELRLTTGQSVPVARGQRAAVRDGLAALRRGAS